MIETLSDARTERGRPISRAEHARELGISERHLRRLVAAERSRPFDVDDLPHVPMVWGESRERWHYRLDCDRASVLPDSLFWIGRRRGRQLVRQTDRHGLKPAEVQQSRAKFRPTQPSKKKDIPSC